MATLEKRITMLESATRTALCVTSSSTDAELIAFIACHLGHKPTDEELHALVDKRMKNGKS